MFWQRWKISAAVAAMVAGIGLVAREIVNADDAPRLAETLRVIDVETGDAFEVDLDGKGYVMPGRSPKSGKRALVAVVEDDGGGWRVPERFLVDLENAEVDVRAVNPKTVAVNVDLREFEPLEHPSRWDRAVTR